MCDRSMTCCFTGNRPEKLPWGNDERHPDCLAFKRALYAQLETLVAEGYRRFICGMARGGDTWFAEAVLQLKKNAACGDRIRLEAAVPCPEQPDAWSEADRKRYREILSQCDEVTTVSPHYTRYCMMKRNAYMVDAGSVVISLLRSGGGTQNTLTYARKRGVRVIEL